MKNRIYLVTTPAGQSLVDAANRAQAIAHVARKEIGCVVATTYDVARLAGAGLEVQSASAAPPEQLELPGAGYTQPIPGEPE